MKRPRIAMWLKWHWNVLRWIPWLGGVIWYWADNRVEKWHAAKDANPMAGRDLPG